MRRFSLSEMAKAFARPGMDTRIWASLAVIRHFCIDPEEGPVADILLLPSRIPETARVGSFYAGEGFGFYRPLYVGDEVLVIAPSGDPNQGLIIQSVMHSPAHLPPQAYSDNPNDVILWVKKDKTFRLGVEGAGNIKLLVDSGKVYLGDEEGTEPTVRGTSLKTFLTSVVSKLTSLASAVKDHKHGGVTSGSELTASGVTSVPTFDNPSDAILATKAEVK